MLYPIKVVDIEISTPVYTITGLEKYMGLQALVRFHGNPLGYLQVPIISGEVSAKVLVDTIIEKFRSVIYEHGLKNMLDSTQKVKFLLLKDFLAVAPIKYAGSFPLVTVVVCTRNRTSDLALCLTSLNEIDYPNLDLLVVDNAPDNLETKLLLATSFPNIRYVLEPRPGLDWARNRAIKEAYGEIVAYTDDDVIVDPGWVQAIAALFAKYQEVMAVTGLVVPYELETEPQVLFEQYGGFGRGFKRTFNQYKNGSIPWGTLGTGQFGTGANMAYRRSIFDKIGFFDPALDVGTITNGGGDLEMFFRVLKEGYTLVYEPAAIVKHRHRRDYAQLKVQLTNNSKGLLAYCMRSIKAYPLQRSAFIRLWVWWIQKWNFDRLAASYMSPKSFPRELIYAELKGCFGGLHLYKRANKRAAEIASQYGDIVIPPAVIPVVSVEPVVEFPKPRMAGIGLCAIDLSEPLPPLTDILNYGTVRYFLNWNKVPVGSIDISNNYSPLDPERFITKVVDAMAVKILQHACNINDDALEIEQIASLQQKYKIERATTVLNRLSNNITVSIVVATYDRPVDLNFCLKSLINQQTERPVQIVVVDNNPGSGLTKPVVEGYPGVVLVNETKKGLSYARNSGICASNGKIILSTDDDVIAPIDWVENLVAPFAAADVMVVTGNVLPAALETQSQQLFEAYGGLGRGFQQIKVNGEWFETYKRGAVPTWRLGACANAAFRASIFNHPQIGLINEKLGAGTATGCSEDTYLFYKVLKLGYSLVYEPKAYVWHNHRKTIQSFHKQLYNYSKGHVAYHLETWLVDKDWRGFSRILIEIPRNLIRRFVKSLRGQGAFPPLMILYEMAGTVAGPWALFRSTLRVKRLGKSAAYVPFNAEATTEAN